MCSVVYNLVSFKCQWRFTCTAYILLGGRAFFLDIVSEFETIAASLAAILKALRRFRQGFTYVRMCLSTQN